ncbi:MAG: amino acid ABC transporter permease [Propionibacteriaceae bacterium]|jgi:glutamate transport system permease protein|nr:amino acid ABC transporter permease [Propionibacteriaceae bacterium]
MIEKLVKAHRLRPRAEHSVLFDSPGPRTKRVIAVANVIGVALVAALIYYVGVQLGEKGQLDADKWRVVVDPQSWTSFFLPGLLNTFRAALVAIVGAIVFGLVFGVGRLSMNPLLRRVCGTIVEFLRAVPVLMMMLFLWSFLGRMGLPNPDFWAVSCALILYNGSVVAELVRAGVINLPKGQHEAAEAIGLTRAQALRYVLVPQALMAMLPALIAQLVVALKDSALGVAIGYSELLREAQVLGTPYRTLQTLVVASTVFIIINYLLGKAGEKLAARMKGRTSRLTDDFADDIPMNVSALASEAMLAAVDRDGYNEQNLRGEPGWLDDDMFETPHR